MKRMIWIFLLLLLIQPAEALELPEEVEDVLPSSAEELLDELEGDDVGVPNLAQGLALLWDKACILFLDMVRQSVGSAVLLLGVVLLCALAEDCFRASENSRVMDVVPMAGAMAITGIAAGSMGSLISLGVDTMEELNLFSKALLPTLTAAVAAGGGVVSASVRQVAAVFFSDVLITLIRELLLPLVYVHIAASAADVLVPGRRLKTIAGAIRKGASWLLTGSLVLYTGYLTLAGVAAGSADALTVQLTRSAMGTVPVVGGIISDAAGTVLAGASALKNTIGIAGMLAVLALCLVPFMKLAVQYLLYKVTAFLAGTIGPPALVELIDALGSAFGLVLGMTGACATLLLISITTSVMVVVT